MTTAKELLEQFNAYWWHEVEGEERPDKLNKERFREVFLSALHAAQESVRPKDTNHSTNSSHCNCSTYEVKTNTKKFWEGVE